MGLIMDLLMLLGGVAVFMFGMKQMSKGIESSAGVGVRKLFKKIDKNRLIDYLIGIGSTAIVQSSSATAIMTVGLANAEIVTVKQGSGIILGAKVGTTLTAFIFAIGLMQKGSFSISALFASLAFVGVIITYSTSNDTANRLALFLIGFGMLFVGLEVMETAIGGHDSLLSTKLTSLFQYSIMENPFLLVILGVIFTCIIQSSTAAVGIFLAFLATGVISSLDQSFFLVMGANIGTCLDGILAAIGANAKGKKIALFHVLTSTIGAFIFTIILIIFKNPIINWFQSVFTQPQWSLAIFNLIYNTIYTLLLLLVLTPLLKLIDHMIKDQPNDQPALPFIDRRLLSQPPVAIGQAVKEVYRMALKASDNLKRAFNALITQDLSESKIIASDEYEIDFLTKELASFLIDISAVIVYKKDEKLIGSLHHVINDIERIGDHAVGFAKEANYMKQNQLHFIDLTKDELNNIFNKITTLIELSYKTFKSRKITYLKAIATLQLEIESDIEQAKEAHIDRLRQNLYSLELSKSVYETLQSFIRIDDHLINIAFSIRSNTGSKTEVFKSLKNKL